MIFIVAVSRHDEDDCGVAWPLNAGLKLNIGLKALSVGLKVVFQAQVKARVWLWVIWACNWVSVWAGSWQLKP